MGELIKNLGTIKIGDAEYLVELNKGTHKGKKYDIHIQNEKIRLNIDEYDFCKMAAAIIRADDRLHHYKKRR